VHPTYLEELAQEIRSSVPSGVLPGEDTTDLFVTYAVLLLAKGGQVSTEDVHNAWVGWMISRGEQHASMVPLAELSPETQAKDSPFVVAIRSVAQKLSAGGSRVG
jgi:hypothetical protein